MRNHNQATRCSRDCGRRRAVSHVNISHNAGHFHVLPDHQCFFDRDQSLWGDEGMLSIDFGAVKIDSTWPSVPYGRNVPVEPFEDVYLPHEHSPNRVRCQDCAAFAFRLACLFASCCSAILRGVSQDPACLECSSSTQAFLQSLYALVQGQCMHATNRPDDILKIIVAQILVSRVAVQTFHTPGGSLLTRIKVFAKSLADIVASGLGSSPWLGRRGPITCCMSSLPSAIPSPRPPPLHPLPFREVKLIETPT